MGRIFLFISGMPDPYEFLMGLVGLIVFIGAIVLFIALVWMAVRAMPKSTNITAPQKEEKVSDETPIA
jgi:hypothetical protein